jgi:hypothetical protein
MELSKHRVVVISLFIAACSSTGTPSEPGSPAEVVNTTEASDGGRKTCSLEVAPRAADLQAVLFRPSCGASSSCHSGTGQQAGLDFSSLEATCNTLREPSCQFPDQPRAKRLVAKLSCAGEDCEGAPSPSCSTRGNARMPLGGEALDPCVVDVVRAWVEGGLEGCP